MEVPKLIKKYLAEGKMMQVASVSGDQPWICTVHYAEDADQNLYWLSLPSRRHSQEIAYNNKVAVAIAVKFDQMPVIGIQAEGAAEAVMTAGEVAKLMQVYSVKHGVGQDFHDSMVAGTNQHQLYKFIPTKYYLFDEVNFPDGQKREWIIKEQDLNPPVLNVHV